MLEKAMLKRWKERARNYYSGVASDKEKEDNEKCLEKQVKDDLSVQALLRQSTHFEAAEEADKLCDQEHSLRNASHSIPAHHNTKPLLLDAVLTPESETSLTAKNYSCLLFEAREERNTALQDAQIEG